jgi:APA family basic amino acid/polyamine antiporter
MSGFVSIIVGFAAPIAAAAIALNFYLGSVLEGWIVVHYPVNWAAAITVIVLAQLHLYDLRFGSRFQVAITALLVALIVIFILGMLAARPTAGLQSLIEIHPSFLLSSPFAVVLIYVAFTYAGWNAAAYIGTELKHPERTLPRALLLGTILVTVLYLLLNLCFLLVAPAKDLAGVEDVGRVIAGRLWGNSAANVVSILIAVTLLCPTSAMLMVGPRIAEAMARDGFLFPGLARLNGRKVPTRAVLMMASLASIIAVWSSFDSLLIYIGFVLNIFAALTVVSLFRLRREGRAVTRICIGYPVTPIVFLIFTIWMTAWSIQTEPKATLAGLATLVVGYILYLLHAKEASSSIQADSARNFITTPAPPKIGGEY